MIYFIACPAAEAVKIGTTIKRSYLSAEASAFQRLSVMQSGCPLELELLAICEGGAIEELALHVRFAEHRLRGEWFRATPELQAHIAQFAKPVRLPRGWNKRARLPSASGAAIAQSPRAAAAPVSLAGVP